MKPGYLDMLVGVLKQFSDFLGERKWFAGDKVRHFRGVVYVLVIFKFVLLRVFF